MSAARMGATKWADVAEDSEEDDFKAAKGGSTGNFRTNPDKDGNFMEIQYAERDGKTYKVIKRMKQTITSSWTNDNIQARKDLKKFGKAASNDPASEKHLVVRSEEAIPIEFSRKLAAQAAVKDEAEDKFYEESLNIAENMNQPKKAWTEANRLKQIDRDEGGAERPAEPDKPSELREWTEANRLKQIDRDEGGAERPAEPDKPSELRDLGASMKAGDAPKSTYVPPSLRGRTGEDPKGKGKDNFAQQQEASLRITNISEDCREGDLQDLFGQVGRLQRVYLAKDQTTGLSRGFAFVTYYTREDAQKAINKLHGHGYDNLMAEDKFYEESLNIAENMNQPKKAWTEANRLKQIDRDEGGAERPAEPDKPSELRDFAANLKAGGAPTSTYVPPSLRGKGGEDPKGKGKDNFAQQQEASLRITNLSEDCREGDLQDLFGQVGRLQRVYLAKDQTTGLSRGFAFVTYYTREDAQKAINKLHGHGYDNLILQVQFAKPRV
eukprot:CAMPEP_0198607114 /NCGR_PEP_ID=MMETSP1462-20131121/155234_1 /TAXON_ID=1333877 /ORGANISM="Brandtodinium nutriculum, Strain RCC3387" /LENGTH=495 /DNA_ID=CAMNT_0044338921 /DNA_START=53 /DNA_END=1540 /DNA_ORIENTATION=+